VAFLWWIQVKLEVERRDANRPDGAETPEMEVEAEDAIVVASEGDESSGGWQRHLRKPSTKAKQNEKNQTSIDTVFLSSRKHPGNISRIAITSGTQSDEMGGDVGETRARYHRRYRSR
jgi:hypothetical protein